MWEDFDLRDNRTWTFSTHYYGLWNHILARFDVKNVLTMDLFLTNTAFVFSRHYLMDWSGVDHCDVFISCLDSYSDGTHSLQSIHCWASDVMLHFSKSDEDTNSSTLTFNSNSSTQWNKKLNLALFNAHISVLDISVLRMKTESALKGSYDGISCFPFP